jgi:hypothetical protein
LILAFDGRTDGRLALPAAGSAARRAPEPRGVIVFTVDSFGNLIRR